MKKYLFTCDKFKGSIIYLFDDEGKTCGFNTEHAEIKPDTFLWFARNMQPDFKNTKILFQNYCKTKYEFEEMPREPITFEKFWNRYDNKTLSDKKESEKLWNKLDEIEQFKAYDFITKYFLEIGTIRKKYADTYLRRKAWNN